MSSIFRVREVCDNSYEELKESYLWFSRRCGFKDINDANIGEFFTCNNTILKALKRHMTEDGIQELCTLMDCTGICCFTKELPSLDNKSHFPRNKDSICIEYHKETLENFFSNSHYAMADCFKEIVYADDILKLEQDGDYHILVSQDTDGSFYESVYALTKDEKALDKLMWMALTRISTRFSNQKESRIILGGRNIPSFDKDLKGYQVPIPPSAIKAIHIYPNTSADFIKRLKKTPRLEEKIKMVSE